MTINLLQNNQPNEFEGQYECRGEDRGKYKTFSNPMEKEVTNIDKVGND